MKIEDESKLDLNLYSRQIGAFGVETMTKLIKLRVLMMGMSGLGLETAKNLILSGPKSVKIWDNRVCLDSDIEFNYYLKKENVEKKMTRAQALKDDLTNLNSYVDVDILDLSNLKEILNESVLENFDLVIVTDIYPLDQMQELNNLLRLKNKGFICAATLGLFGFTFTDFVQHKVYDKNGEPKKQVLVTSIDSEGIVTTEEKKRHDLENNDIIKFTELVGMEKMNGVEFRVKDVLTPFSFKIDFEGKDYGKYSRNGIVEQVKEIIDMKFNSLQDVMEKPHMTMIDCDMDFLNMDKVFQFKVMLRTLWRSISKNGIPDFFNTEKMEIFLENLKIDLEKEIALHEELLNKDKKSEDSEVSKKDWIKILETNIPKLVFSLAKGTYAPICSFYGGIVAQEAVKFTGKFTPINQLFIHEFYTGLFKEISFEDVLKNKNDVENNRKSRYLSQIALLGNTLQKKLFTSKVFMIGAGALGCEYLKLFSIMGMSCDPEGQFIVTDDDTIEVSNLNRQFLFRKHHVGKSKSFTASNVVKTFNPEFNVVSKENRASLKTENVFTDNFWDSLSFVVNAVDNVKARTYVDQKSVFHNKMLFESGTLGTKCNSQLIIPNLTECYSDSQDPPEKSVPMCTMRSFPYLINHCIEWARVKFFELFVNSSTFLNEFFQDIEKGEKDVMKRMKEDMSELKQIVEFIPHYIDLMAKNTLKEYVKLALFFYQHFFDGEIAKLLALFPADYKDKDGNLFWTSPKRPPVNIPFDKSNEDHMKFVTTAVQVLSQVFPPIEKFTNKDVEQLVKTMKINKLELKINEEDRKKLTNEKADEKEESDEENVLMLLKQLKSCYETNKNLVIKEIEFEKDDDTNGHIDLMASFSNFRAINYEIPVAPRHKIKLIAGKIIPAIATATAMVCGTVGIEIYKYLLNVNIEQRRNFFSNLAIPIFSFSEPIPPVVQKDKDYDVILMGPVVTIPKNWNTWSKIEIKGSLTLQQVIDEIKKEYGFVVSSFVCNSIQVWCSYMNSKNERLGMKMEDILVDIGFPPYEGKKYQEFSISGETDDMIDVYCPMLKYHLG